MNRKREKRELWYKYINQSILKTIKVANFNESKTQDMKTRNKPCKIKSLDPPPMLLPLQEPPMGIPLGTPNLKAEIFD